MGQEEELWMECKRGKKKRKLGKKEKKDGSYMITSHPEEKWWQARGSMLSGSKRKQSFLYSKTSQDMKKAQSKARLISPK